MNQKKFIIALTLATGALVSGCTSMESRNYNRTRNAAGPYQPTRNATSEAPPPPRYGQAPTHVTTASRSTASSGINAAAIREDQRIAQEFRESMKMRIDQLATENNQLTREIATLRQQQNGNSATQSEISSLRSQLSQLESKFAAIDHRSKQNQATLKEVPQTIHSLLAQQRPAPTPRAPAAPTPRPRTEEGYEYIVGAGDTLSAIAAAYNVSPKTIIDANNLKNPDNLKVAQKLFIPK